MKNASDVHLYKRWGYPQIQVYYSKLDVSVVAWKMSRYKNSSDTDQRFTFHFVLSTFSYYVPISSCYFWTSSENHHPGPGRHKYYSIIICQEKTQNYIDTQNRSNTNTHTQNVISDLYTPFYVSVALACPPPSLHSHPHPHPHLSGSHLPSQPHHPPWLPLPLFLKWT